MLHRWTTELPQEVLEALLAKDDTQGTLRFRGSPAILKARKPGEVIVAGKSTTAPKGFARAIVSMRTEGDDTVVETLPVPLPLAFKNLHAKLTRQVPNLAQPGSTSSTQAALKPSVYSSTKVVGNKRIFDGEAFNQDHDPSTKDDQFLIHAELEGRVEYTATVDLDWLDDPNVLDVAFDCLTSIITEPWNALEDCVPIPDVKIGFGVSLSGKSLLDVDGASAANYEPDPITLNEEPWELPPLTAGPVVLTPELDFTARLRGDASTFFHARTEFGYEVSVSASAGIKSGVTPPVPKFTKQVTKPVVEVSSSGHSKASFGPRLSLLAYDIFGFYAELHGYGELDADQGKTPCWNYVVGVELTPGIRLRIPWKKFGLQSLARKLGWDVDLVNANFGTLKLFEDKPFDGLPASERACSKPPDSALPLGEGPSSETYQTPTFTPWSFRYGGVQATQPHLAYPGQSRSLIEKGHDSSWVVSGAYLGGVLDLSDKGVVRWARALEIGCLPEEDALALDKEAESALAIPSKAMTLFVASDRLTLLSLDYAGALQWARRLLPPGQGVADEELRRLSPVALVKLPAGDFGILYSRRTTEGENGEVLVLRVSSSGTVRFAKRFHFSAGNTSLGTALVPVGDDLWVVGLAHTTTEDKPYLLRFDKTGALNSSARLEACGSTRSRVEAATLRASGDLALLGVFEMAPERTFFTTLSTQGVVRGATAFWSGSNVQDFSAIDLAELPTSGFVSLGVWTPYVGNGLELSTHDSLGARTAGKGFALKNQEGTNLANTRPAGLRLTTDGGALVVAHVSQDKAFDDDGLWISKIPARTFEWSYDSSLVSTVTDAFPPQDCTVTLSNENVAVTDVVLDGLDVTGIARANPLTPLSEPRAQ